MARTRRQNRAQSAEQALTAAVYQLQPRPRGMNETEAKREVDIMLRGNSTDQLTNLAWYFYDKIPELRYIARYVANSLSQARLFVGEVQSDPFNPQKVDASHPANALLEGFAGGFEGQAELLDRLGLHLTVAGDSILAGPRNPDGPLPKKPFDQYRIWSSYEIYSSNGVLYWRRQGYKDQILPENAMAFRVWRSHPRRWEQADSPTLSSFTVLREIDLLDQHVHSSAVSRLAGAGVWLLPDELDFPTDETSVDGEDIDPFVKYITDVMSIALKNPESAAARVPIILRGPMEAINAAKDGHLTFETPFSEQVPDLRNVALRRLALGMDVPPEVLLGMSESTQWSAWQTDESTVRLHTVPLLQLIVNSLTVGWFRPALKRQFRDLKDDEINRLTIWFDISNLRVRPSVSEESQALYDRFEIGGDTLRLTSGFTAAEKPNKDELETQILFHLLKNNQDKATYVINTLIEKKMINLPKIEEPVMMAPGQPGPDGKPDTVDVPGGKGLPGERSRERQSSPPPTPKAEGDDSNNEVK